MIKTFKHKALAELFETGRSAKIDSRLVKPLLVRLDRLDRLDVAEQPDDMNLPGFDFHALNGFAPTHYTVHVNGPWCITFEFENGEALRVDLEQYH